ncbi:MAG: response regulator transcription factor [Prevotella sp.]|nr:response regulator transcription factor [Prevotella sp.]
MERIRILLVDDDRQNSEFLLKFLEVEGYEVTYAENGRKGWEAFSAAKPDLVLLDVNMPEMNGFELARLIRQQDHDVLIFFLTDRTEKADRLKGFSLQGNDYIPKPFYPEELIAKIKERQRVGGLYPGMRFDHRQPSLPARITIGQTIFDRNLSTIETGGVVQHLSARQSEIFTILAQHIGQTVERSHLLQSVWGNDSYANSLALNVQITYLRKALAADSTISIASLKKRGYILEVSK